MNDVVENHEKNLMPKRPITAIELVRKLQRELTEEKKEVTLSDNKAYHQFQGKMQLLERAVTILEQQ